MTSTVLLSTQTQLQAWPYKESIVFNTDFLLVFCMGLHHLVVYSFLMSVFVEITCPL